MTLPTLKEADTFYKVFAIGSFGHLRSLYYSTLHQCLRLEYVRDSWNYPVVGRLFTIKHLGMAKNHCDAFLDAVVWSVEVEDPSACYWCRPTYSMDPEACEKFWQRRGVWEWPPMRDEDSDVFFRCTFGTYAVTGVKLIEPVYISHELAGHVAPYDCCGQSMVECFVTGRYYYRCRNCGQRATQVPAFLDARGRTCKRSSTR